MSEEKYASAKQIEWYGHLGITAQTPMAEAKAKIDASKAKKAAEREDKAPVVTTVQVDPVYMDNRIPAIKMEILKTGFITNLDDAEAVYQWIMKK